MTAATRQRSATACHRPTHTESVSLCLSVSLSLSLSLSLSPFQFNWQLQLPVAVGHGGRWVAVVKFMSACEATQPMSESEEVRAGSCK